MPFVLNRAFFKTISFRVVAFFCVTFTIGVSLAFLITYFEISYSLENSSKEVISAKLREATVVLSDHGIEGLKVFFSVEKNRITNAPFMIRVLGPGGDTLYIKPSVQEEQFDFENAFKKVIPGSLLGWHSLSAINDEDKFDMLTEKVGSGYYLQIGKSSEDREAILGKILLMFGFSGLLLIVLSGGFGLWYARKILRPVRELVDTISEMEKGDLSQRVKLGEARDELYDLGSTFNRMVSRVESLVKVMRESLDNVAHDIRTPLTRIKAVSEDAILSGSPVLLREALEDCAETASNTSEVVDQLMSISEADAGTLKLRKERCDITVLLSEVIEIYEFVVMEKSISVSLDVQERPLEWVLDRKRTKQAVANLLDNAVKFSDENSKIEIAANIEDEHLVISVRDEGHGIPEEDLLRIWDRLFRGDKSRSTKGAGLGLSIVRAVTLAHKGSAFARPNPVKGTTFFIRFPVLQA